MGEPALSVSLFIPYALVSPYSKKYSVGSPFPVNSPFRVMPSCPMSLAAVVFTPATAGGVVKDLVVAEAGLGIAVFRHRPEVVGGLQFQFALRERDFDGSRGAAALCTADFLRYSPFWGPYSNQYSVASPLPVKLALSFALRGATSVAGLVFSPMTACGMKLWIVPFEAPLAFVVLTRNTYGSSTDSPVISGATDFVALIGGLPGSQGTVAAPLNSLAL